MGLILWFFFAISFITHFSYVQIDQQVEACMPHPEKLLDIRIDGAVEYPGIYHCHPGTALKVVLDQAVLSKRANRRKISFKKILYSSQTITISEKTSETLERTKISLEEK